MVEEGRRGDGASRCRQDEVVGAFQGPLLQRRTRRSSSLTHIKAPRLEHNRFKNGHLMLVKGLQAVHPASLFLRDQPEIELVHVQTDAPVPALTTTTPLGEQGLKNQLISTDSPGPETSACERRGRGTL